MLETKINHMSLLAEAIEKNTRELTIIINTVELNEEKINEIFELIKKHPGKVPFRVRLSDPEDQRSVELKSRKSKIDPTTLVKVLHKLPGLKYKFN